VSAAQQGTKTDAKTSGRALVKHLDSLLTKRDLGALALLRRGLGRQPGEVPEMYAHVLPYLSLPDNETAAQRVEDAALLVASLYALWHQGRAKSPRVEKVSLGTAFRRLAISSDSASMELRFVTLLKAGRDRLPDHLRHAISLLRAKDIPLDWAQLFADICEWDETDRRARHPARRRWARDFWERAREPEGVGIGSAENGAGNQDEA
jgi:CRISPR system Cascade subunit CasB